MTALGIFRKALPSSFRETVTAINTSGEVVVELKYSDAANFTADVAAVQKDGKKWGFIDKTGKELTDFIYTEKPEFSDGLAEVFEQYKSGFVNEKGEVVISLQFEDANRFSEGFAAYESGTDWGYIDKTGKIIVEAKYATAGEFSDGLAAVEKGGLFGYIGTSGDVVISPTYLTAYEFKDGIARVQLPSGTTGGEAGAFAFISKDGKKLFDKTYAAAKDFSEGYAPVAEAENKWGLIDKDGNSVIPCEWDETYAVSDGIVRLSDGGNYRFVKLK